jgi:hypothetical protein
MKRLVEEGYLDKVVFIQPSKIHVREWMETKRTVASFGLILADRDPNGQIFKIFSSGEIKSSPVPVLASPSQDGMSIQRLKVARSSMNSARREASALGPLSA